MRRLLCAAARRQDRLKEFCIMPVYPMDIAGLHRELPICKVTDFQLSLQRMWFQTFSLSL